MELSVRLSRSVLILPSAIQSHGDLDSPPVYDATPPVQCSPTSISYEPSPTLSTNVLSPSLSSSESALFAYINLKPSSRHGARQTLTSLSAKLVAYESIAYNNGGFEQNCPINIVTHVPLLQPLQLVPDQTYQFQAKIPYSSNMPPSMQLQDARLRYRVRIKAKVRPTSSEAMWFGSFFQGKTLETHADLLVLQAAGVESNAFSNVDYVANDGLGSVCVSRTPSPCIIGGSTRVCLAFANPEAKARVLKIDLVLIQSTRVRSRQTSSSASSLQAKPKLYFALQSEPTPILDATTQGLEKRRDEDLKATVWEGRFLVPKQAEVQPTTLPGSNSVIQVWHHLQLSIHFLDPKRSGQDVRSFTCSWAARLAHPEAVPNLLHEDLPVYSETEPLSKAWRDRERPSPSSHIGDLMGIYM